MDEWLSTVGLNFPEKALILALKKAGDRGWENFRGTARFLLEFQKEVVVSAVIKAREQGKCKCWPS